MIILGIESSCDDTSVCLLEAKRGKFKILALKTASQIEVHKKYGGVVPEIAGRCHAENILPVIEKVMNHYHTLLKPDVIAVTAGPGLITGLLVGVEAAKVLSYLWEVPMVAVNHLEGHIYSVLLSGDCPLTPPFVPPFPALCLIVSGGHTEIILMKRHGVYGRIGATLDDAAGECFDKVAKLLGLDYPGGPKISKLAGKGNSQAIDFPRPMLNDDTFNFSFAGLKTAVLYWLRDHAWLSTPSQSSPGRGGRSGVTLADFCASFEQAIVDVLVTKIWRATEKYKPKTVILSGGVSANKKLRATLQARIQKDFPKTTLLIPEMAFTMDNAAMIAAAGYFHARRKEFTPWQKVMVDPNWKLA